MSRQTSLCACASILLTACAVLAQDATGDHNVPYASVGVSTWFSVVHIPAIPNAPFSATTMMDNTQTLADGTTVTTKTMTTIARDSKGRTHNENRYYLTPADNGQGRIRDITIFDPTTRTKTTLVPATMQATVTVVPPHESPSALPGIQPGPQREDLGISSIDGLSIHGFRQSRIIPEGLDGNDRPITITDEYWYSDELRMNIPLKPPDPRHGTQFVTLTQLSRDQPDEKMFEVPAGYNVRTESDTPGAIRISARVAEDDIINRVDPQYPPLAKAARIQGSVEFNVTIGEGGSVRYLELVRGHPLLVNAAKEAVLEWKFRPVLLNGNAVSVTAPVTVAFNLPLTKFVGLCEQIAESSRCVPVR